MSLDTLELGESREQREPEFTVPLICAAKYYIRPCTGGHIYK